MDVPIQAAIETAFREGIEMCIRDRPEGDPWNVCFDKPLNRSDQPQPVVKLNDCLLYTSVNVLYHRIDDLECQRDIYKSRYEDWEGVSKEIAEYADTDVYKRQSPACTRQCWPTPATL